jgi:hypothetical protein
MADGLAGVYHITELLEEPSLEDAVVKEHTSCLDEVLPRGEVSLSGLLFGIPIDG